MDNGKRVCIYVRSELLPLWYNMRKISDSLNISILDVIFNPKYRNDVFVQQELRNAERIINKEMTYLKIKEMMTDIHVAEKCNYGIEILRRMDMPKSFINLYVETEKKLLSYSSLPENIKKKLSVKIKNDKKHLLSRDRLTKIQKIPNYCNNDGLL